ncbi:DUF262 domain-containing protein [Tateyamaria sp. ANG-S1]|uniref:DUF262 domain-containing protein n=1 Tax=Tateyamaria sp. ANG-S1 TaxID=1577905 RepID=UPI00057F0511|nr:DUF262 domain-containing protein [Tateyamaria sp. ANG-S1]KIC51039.1 hypothetical protein RA29_03940 [Tateyamaria sp. ANG-S1]
MLLEEIEKAQRNVRTDAFQMSIGELVNLYDDGDIIIAPEFQRLFRWEVGQKSKLIESLLLGIPLPSIFVYELENGQWELVDGLQRLSSILEFMGKLRDEKGVACPPSVLEATKYLPSLHNAVWEKSAAIADVEENEQVELDRSLQLAIKRSRIGVEILKRPSDSMTKFDLFQRLNAGGTTANAQEIRNCIILMVNADYFRAIKAAAETPKFLAVTGLNEGQTEKQRHIEMAVRLLVHTLVDYDGILDVGEYIDEGIVQLATEADITGASTTIKSTMDLLHEAAGGNALRRFQNGDYSGRVGLVGLEAIAVGVAKNLADIEQQADPVQFVRDKSQAFWEQPEVEGFVSPGMRGTTRIQKTVPFGSEWFKP